MDVIVHVIQQSSSLDILLRYWFPVSRHSSNTMFTSEWNDTLELLWSTGSVYDNNIPTAWHCTPRESKLEPLLNDLSENVVSIITSTSLTSDIDFANPIDH